MEPRVATIVFAILLSVSYVHISPSLAVTCGDGSGESCTATCYNRVYLCDTNISCNSYLMMNEESGNCNDTSAFTSQIDPSSCTNFDNTANCFSVGSLPNYFFAWAKEGDYGLTGMYPIFSTNDLDGDTCEGHCDCLVGDSYWNKGGEVANTTCCGDDAGEYLITQTNFPDNTVDWVAGAQRCCDTSTDHVDYSGNCIPSMDSYGNAVDTGYTGHDKYAAKVSWYGWLDCDRGDGPGGWCSNICPAAMKSGEASVGEYPDTNTNNCCGDDSGENVLTEANGGDAPAGYNDGVQVCCDTSTDCNYNGACVSTATTSSPAIPNKAYCWSSLWYGGDYIQGVCDILLGAGYWNLGGEVNGTACCGDDSGENKVTSVAGAGMGAVADLIACCDASTDCAAANTCTAQSSSYDADGNGDTDYCSASNTWIDCNSDTNCAAGYICSSNDCLPSALNLTVTAQLINPLNSEKGNTSSSWSGTLPSGWEYYFEQYYPYQIKIYNGSSTSYSHTPLEDNTVYYYAAKTRNATNSLQSGFWSRAYAVTPDRTGPSSSNLTAAYSSANNNVQLNWTWSDDEFAPDVANTGLVGRWDFEDGTDVYTSDDSGNGNFGSISGSPPWASGIHGSGALSLDGVDDYVNISDSNSLRISNYTVSVWINPNGVPNEAWKGIVGKPGRNFNIWLNSDGYIHHRFHNASSTDAGPPDTPSGSITWSAWNHVVITNDGATAKTYINGVEQASGSAGQPIADNTPVYLGRNLDGSSASYFNGTIDDIRIYNRSLSSDEVKNLMLIGQWHFDEGTNINPTDASGYGNNGVCSNYTVVSDLGGGLLYEPSVYVYNDRMIITDVGGDNAIWAIEHNGTSLLADWYSLSGGLTTRTRMNADNGTFSVYSIGGDGNLWKRQYVSNGTWLGWLSLGVHSVNPMGPSTAVLNGISYRVRRDTGDGSVILDRMDCNWTSNGVYKGAMQFDGVDDYINISNSETFDITGPMTVESWAYIAALPSAYKGIVEGQSPYYRYLLYISPSNRPEFFITTDSGSYYTDEAGHSETLAIGWNHIAGVYNGSQIQIYLNGRLSYNRSASGSILTDGNGLRIGRYDSTGNFFNGSIDEVRIWRRALSAAEIQGRANYGVYRSNQSDGNYTPVDGLLEDFGDSQYTDTFQDYSGGTSAVKSMGGRDTALCSYGYANDIHVYTQDESFSDALFEFDYYIETSNGDGGIFFRAQDGANGYLISLDPGGAWQAYERNSDSWTEKTKQDYSAGSLDNNEWHHYKLFMRGGKFELYEDDIYRGYFEDSTFASGAVGLRGTSNSSGESCIDNIRVTPLFSSKNATDSNANDSLAPATPSAPVVKTHSTSQINISWGAVIDMGSNFYYYINPVDSAGNSRNAYYQTEDSNSFTPIAEYEMGASDFSVTRESGIVSGSPYSWKMTGTCNTDCYSYWRISDKNYVIQNGDYLLYDVYVDSASSDTDEFFIDMDSPGDAAHFRWTYASTSTLTNQWEHKAINISGLAGTEINELLVAVDRVTSAGTVTAYFDNIQIVNLKVLNISSGVKDYYSNETTGHTNGSTYNWGTSTSYQDIDLAPNAQYCYVVRARDNAMNLGAYSNQACNYTFANVPAGLTATALNANQIFVEWLANGNSAGTNYNLYRNGGSIYENTGASTTDSSLTCNTQYTYKVRAKNDNSIYTTFTSDVSKYTLPETPLLNSTSHTVGVQNGNPYVNLTANTTTVGCASHYHYVWDKSPGTTVNGSDTQWNGTQITLTSTTPGNWYLHAITHNAENASNVGGAVHLGPFVITLDVPLMIAVDYQSDKPLNSQLGKIIVNWSGSIPNGYSYSLEETTPTSIQRYYGNSTSYTNSSLSDNMRYCYRVRFQDAQSSPVYYSDWSSTVCNITKDRTGPDNPNLTLTADNANNSVIANFTEGDSGLVLYMPFEEGTGSTTDDWSPYKNNGNMTGATWNSSAKYGKGLNFDGTNDQVTVSDNTALDSAVNDMTISMWVNPRATQPITYVSLLDRHSCAMQGFTIQQDGAITNAFTFAINVGGTGYCQEGTNSYTQLTSDVWQNFVVQRSGTQVYHYLNGVLTKNCTAAAGALTSTNNPLRVGYSCGSRYFNGSIDEVRIYNRSLTQQEIIDDMQSGLIRKGLYRANTSSGTYAPVGGLFDDFDRASLGSNWSSYGGTWSISSNQMNGTTGSTGVSNEVYYTGTMSSQDYIVEADVKGNSWVNLAFRVQDTNNQYYFWNGPDVIIAKEVSGSYSEPYRKTNPVGWNANTFYHMKVVLKGNSIKAYLNDIQVWDVALSDISSGSVGAGLYGSGDNIYVDNFKVTPLIADNNYTDTSATDLNPPATSTISAATNGATSINLTWSNPADYNTSYYYYLTAFDDEANENNLALNGGMERDSDANGCPDNMTCLGDTAMTTDSSLGNYSVSNSNAYTILDNNVTIPNTLGRTFMYCADMKQSGGATVLLYVYTGKGSDSGWQSFGSYSPTTTWQTICSVNTIVDQGGGGADAITTLRFYRFNQQGTLYVDNIRLYEVKNTTVHTGFKDLRFQTNSSGSWADLGYVSSSPYQKGSLNPNTKYYYRAYSRDNALNENSTVSSVVNALTLAQTPNITAVICGGSYEMGYSCNVTFDMLANPYTTQHYINETSGNMNGTAQNWINSTVVYTDTGLVSNTQYCYAIKARNNDSVETEYSSTVCNTTVIYDTTAPVLNFTSPTENNATIIARNWTRANITIDETALEVFKFNWNGTDYTIYDDSLVLALNFNNNSAIGEGTNIVVDSSKYGNNFSCTSCPTVNASGRFGNSRTILGSTYLNKSTYSALQTTQELTYELWVNPIAYNMASWGTIIEIGGDLNYASGTYLGIYPGNSYYTFYMGNGTSYFNTLNVYVSNVPVGNWTHLAFTRTINSTHSIERAYVNGIIKNTTTSTYRGNIYFNTSYTAAIGTLSYAMGGFNYNGSIDELRIYNRSLSADEILLHYQSEFQKYNSTQYRFYANLTNLTSGTYTYYGWANDTHGNSNYTINYTATSPRYVYVDLTSPIVTIISPTAITYGTNSVALNYTVTDNLAGVSSCWYSLDGAANQTLAGCQNTTLSSLNDGNHTVIVYANDTVGNIGQAQVSFNISTLDLYLTKTYAPDTLIAYEINQVNVTARLKINKSSYSVKTFNLTDEIPWDFTIDNSTITVTLQKYSPYSETDVTGNVNILVRNLTGLNNQRIEVTCANTSICFGGYLAENDTILLNYPMNSSGMDAGENRNMTLYGNVTDINNYSKNRTLSTNITVSVTVLRGYKDITVNLANPQNLSAHIVITSIGGTLGNILLSDYLPEGAYIYDKRVVWFDGSVNRTLTAISDYNVSIKNVTLPGNYLGEGHLYDFINTGTTWPGHLNDNESIIIDYNFTVLGGGQWDLPTIISGYDPTYNRTVKTEMYANANVPSFDVILEILTKKVQKGEIAKGLLKIINVGGPRAKVDVYSNYAIKSMDGKTINEKSETIAVVEQKERILELDVPDTTTSGRYVFETYVSYVGREALSTDTFEVIGENKSDFLQQYGLYILIGLVIIINLFLLLRKR